MDPSMTQLHGHVDLENIREHVNVRERFRREYEGIAKERSVAGGAPVAQDGSGALAAMLAAAKSLSQPLAFFPRSRREQAACGVGAERGWGWMVGHHRRQHERGGRHATQNI